IACSSFGGYMAMISATQNLVVERRKLLSDDDVLNGVSLASILPGPIAINVVAYVGYRLRGNLGALVSVCAAITPALLLMLLLSFAYIHLAHLEVVGHIF
ncbi:MAG: chromate transporter, partial [Pseudomonadota bacterium]